MASEISGSKAKEIRDLNSSYDSKRQEVIDRGERRLKETSQYYQKREEKLREHGQAAVNHIKKQNKESIDELNSQSKERLNEHQNKVQEMYRHLAEQREVHKQKIQQSSQDMFREQKVYRQKKDQQINKLQEEYQDRVSHNEQFYQHQLEESEQRSKEKIRANNLEATQKLQTVQKRNTELLQETNRMQQEYYGQLKKSHQKQVDNLNHEHRLQIQSVIDQKNQTVANMQEKFIAQQTKQKEINQQKLEEFKRKNKTDIEAQVNLQTYNQEKLRLEYDREIKRLHQEGEAKLHLNEEVYRKNLEKQDSFYKNELDQKNAQHQVRLQELDKNFQMKSESLAIEHDKQIQRQEKEHRQKYESAALRNQGQLSNQAQVYSKAILKQREEMVGELNKYSGKENDPFYQTMTFDNKLLETQSNYLFEVQIPEHEKDNIDIRVQKDKITISGTRQYKEDFLAENQRFVTNSNQSFYQEIPLKNNVKQNEVKTWFEGNTFKLIAPKA